jgi:hypothetical protein
MTDMNGDGDLPVLRHEGNVAIKVILKGISLTVEGLQDIVQSGYERSKETRSCDEEKQAVDLQER